MPRRSARRRCRGGGGRGAARHEAPQVDVPFVTIDPPGARDLDQALHLERRGDGHRVRYAIADVGAFVRPGRRHRRGGARARRDRLRARRRGRRSTRRRCRRARRACCPGSGRRRCCGRSTSTGTARSSGTQVERAQVRSRAQHTYEDVPAEVAALLRRDRGAAARRWSARGAACSSACPSRSSCATATAGPCRTACRSPTEDHNAQISLLTGIAAAQLMLERGHGDPAHAARAGRGGVRAAAPAGARRWASRGRRTWRTRTFVRTLDAGAPATRRSCARRPGSARARATPRSTASRPRDGRALRDRRAVRARDRAAAPAAGPVRVGVLPGGVARRARAGVGPRGAAGAARR